MSKKKNDNQSAIPGTEPPDGPRPLTVWKVVERIIAAQEHYRREGESRAQRVRAQWEAKGLEKSKALIARLAGDAERDLAHRMVQAYFAARRDRSEHAQAVAEMQSEESSPPEAGDA